MVRSRFALPLVVALCALPLTLAACGGDDDDDGGSDTAELSADEKQIVAAATAAATTPDPEVCTKYETQRFVEQTTGETGQAALERCREDAEDTVAGSIEVSNIQVDGDTATAEGAITGSFFDGQTIAVELVKEGDQWKLDQLTGFVEFDREAFLASFEQTLSEEAPAEAVDCAVQELDQLSDEQFEELFINSNQELEAQVFGECFQGQG